VSHLLVTNDFPPKLGGIQSYLYELWRRLDPASFTVFTTSYPGAAEFDRAQAFRVVRSRHRVLTPIPPVTAEIRGLIDDIRPDLVVFDPVLPIGLAATQLGQPYALVLHGAEVTVPGRLPGSRQLLGHVIRGARLVVAAGGYPAAEGRRAARVSGAGMPRFVVVPPGVDVARFRPLDEPGRRAARSRLGLPEDGHLVVSVSRLVPRKGMDVLIEAVAALAEQWDDLLLVIGGSGRDRSRLERLAERQGAPVRLLGRVDEDDLPLLNASADVWAMLCRDRWLRLEQEGFGIVFLEAAACGVPQVAGRSGGAGEAVVDGETGLVVNEPSDPGAVRHALARLLAEPDLRRRLGAAARARAVEEFDYDVLAGRLRAALEAVGA